MFGRYMNGIKPFDRRYARKLYKLVQSAPILSTNKKTGTPKGARSSTA